MTDKNNNTVNAHISQSLTSKVEDLVKVFSKNYEINRPFCNRVMVKVPRTELLAIETRKQMFYKEQEFKLTKDTDFETLRISACDFWGLNQEEYSLYDDKMSHLMALNNHINHPAHSVSDYFEILKKRYPSLYLLKDELEKPEIKDNDVKNSAKIAVNNTSKTGKNLLHMVESNDKKAIEEIEI